MNFATKCLHNYVASIHEGKKVSKYKFYDQKRNLNTHNTFFTAICKSSFETYIDSVHEGNKHPVVPYVTNHLR